MLRTALCAGAALVVACGSSSGGGDGPIAQGGTVASLGGASNAGASAAGPSGGSATSSAGTGNVAGAGNGTSGGGAPAGGTTSAGTAGTGGTMPGGDLWVATDGNDANPGTEALPILNLPNALARVAAGHTIWMKAGTYKYSAAIQIKKSGTATAEYTISAAPGTRPIVNFAGSPAATRGFDLQGDYWHFVGFEVENAMDNCIAISGSHNTIENMTIHGCADTGLQITVSSANVADNTRGANNLVLNTDSYENFDAATGGENADGFAAKLRIGPGNVFRGCRAYNNSDDGWDFFAADDVVEIDGSWAFCERQGRQWQQSRGRRQRLQARRQADERRRGRRRALGARLIRVREFGLWLRPNNNPDVPKVNNCGAKDNGKDDYCGTLSKTGSATMTMTAAQAKAVKRNADGSLPPMK